MQSKPNFILKQRKVSHMAMNWWIGAQPSYKRKTIQWEQKEQHSNKSQKATKFDGYKEEKSNGRWEKYSQFSRKRGESCNFRGKYKLFFLWKSLFSFLFIGNFELKKKELLLSKINRKSMIYNENRKFISVKKS